MADDIRELYRRSKYLKYLLESSVDIIMFVDRDGLIAYCSDTMLQSAGISDVSSIAGKPFYHLYAKYGGEELARQGLEHFERVRRSLEASEAEVHIRFAENDVSHVYNVNVSPMIDDDGQFDGVIATHFDTTKVRDTEADEYTHIMLDATPLACALWDENGSLLDCNLEKLRMFGLSKKSDYMKYMHMLSPVFQPDGSRSFEALKHNRRRALAEGYLRFDWVHNTLSGEPLPVEATFVRVPWKGGYRLATYLRDLRKLTETQKIAKKADARSKEFETQMQAALVASEAKSRFLASVSHEIRTPMNAIIGMSELMRTDNLDMTQKAFFEDIKKMSKSLLQIINDVLDFSRIEAGRMEIAPVHFNLMEMYGNICSMSHFLADSKGLYFVDSFDSEIPSVIFGDDVRIRQVILNIINNSIKYTREGTVSFEMRRDFIDGAPYISFEIRDTGIGIKENDIPMLFNAFYQVDMTVNRGIDGSGLGLSITKNLVSLMGGEIKISSVYGAGTVFTVMLPLIEGKPELVSDQNKSVYFRVHDGARVLIVDDSQINLKVATAYLEKFNIQAETALSGPEAIVKMQNQTGAYHLILMDHMMPGMDGVATTRRLRSMGYTDVPIIALTANAMAGIGNLYAQSGMNDVITKPIDAAQLGSVLIHWMPPELIPGAVSGLGNKPPSVEGGGAQHRGLQDARRAGGAAPYGDGNKPPSLEGGGAKHRGLHDMLIDYETGLMNATGDKSLYNKILLDFLYDHGLDHHRIKEAIDEGSYPEATRLAHTLKGSAALIGANRLKQAAQYTEKALSEATREGVKQTLHRLDSELTAVVDIIEQRTPELNRKAEKQNKAEKPNASFSSQKAEPPLTSYTPSSPDGVSTTPSTNIELSEAFALIDELRPLLISGNAKSLDYTDEITRILGTISPESYTLLDQIENFDFENAAETLVEIHKNLH